MMVAAWVGAARPATLWAAFAPVLVGTAAAYGAGCFRLGPALAALFGAVWIQIGTNFANDLFDFRRGADTAARLGPIRAVQSGVVSPRSMAVATALAFGLAVMAGLYLASVAGAWVVAIGIASIVAGLAYTGGPFPLGYNGLGDVFVFVFFGLVAVAGTAFVQCLEVPAQAWAAAVAIGCLSTAILVVNNLRDRYTDAEAGKRTLAVLLGERATRWQFAILVVLAFAIPAARALAAFRGTSVEPGWGSAWLALPLLALPLAVVLVRRVAIDEGAQLNRSLGGTARLLLIYSVLYALALIAAA